jgi:hypothetical protein
MIFSCCLVSQQVWCGKVLELPNEKEVMPDGSVMMREIKIGWYLTKVARSARAKQAIYGTMYPAEKIPEKDTEPLAPDERTKKRKNKSKQKEYLELYMDFTSEHFLRVFDPDCYLVKNNGKTTMKNMLKDHVKEACDFYSTRKRYLSWLVENAKDT